MSPVSQVRDPGHVTKVTRFGPYFRGLLEAEDGERSFVKELKSFAEFSVSTQCTFLLVRSFIDPTFCGIFRLRSFAVNNLFLSGLNVGISTRTATE